MTPLFGNFAGAVLLAASAVAIAQANTPSERCASTAFVQQRQGFFDAVPPGALKDLGLDSLNALRSLQPGTPYMVYTLPPSAVLQNPPTAMAETSLVSTGMWHIPLRSGEHMRLFAVVQQTPDDRCQLVSLGYARLAQGFSRLMAAKSLGAETSQGRLVQIPQALETLWIDGEGVGARAYRLSEWVDGGSASKFKASDLPKGSALTEVLQQLAPTVRRNLNGG
jgi:hypothetical protein